MLYPKRLRSSVVVAFSVALIVGPGLQAHALDTPIGTAFTYQGKLRQSGQPAKGTFDLKFRLYSDAVGGDQIGPEISVTGAQIDDGYFSADLDFGQVYAGKRWI